jgi:subtilisin
VRPTRSLLALAIAVAACGASAASASARGIPGDYIVVLNDSAGDPGVVASDHAKKDGAAVSHVFRSALRGYSAKIPDARINDVRNDPRVAYVNEDFEVQASGAVPLAAGETVPTGIRREGAAAGTTVGATASSAVAVIDTGIDLSHPDLNAAAGTNCVNSSAQPIDDNGHGSHVSGSIAAKNTGAGVVGAAPGTQLYAVKVLNSAGSGTGSQVICGIDWVTAHAAGLHIKVANMSLGGTGAPLGPCSSTTDAEHAAICNATKAGVTFVVAAGNSGRDYALGPDVPAAYPEVLTVTAMSDSDGQPGALGGAPSCRTSEFDDRYAGFSNYATGSAAVDHTIAGPGVCIYSTWMSGGYNTISGTSMATPNVAGLVAECLDDTSSTGCAGKTPAQVIAQMRANAQAHATSTNGFTGDPFSAFSGRYYGYLAWGGIGGGSTPPPPPANSGDYALSASPNSLTIARTATGQSTIAVAPSGGFTGSVSLAASCPARVSCTLSPTSVAGSGSSALSISPNRKATKGTYTVTVTGSSSGLPNHSTTVTLTIS